jgi:hypothetical protein
MDWANRVAVGDYLAFEAVRIVNPDTYNKVFNDSWLKEYTTALFKEQWGSNLKKYGNFVLPGGMVINGQQIYDEAVVELKELDEKLRDVYESPPQMLVG